MGDHRQPARRDFPRLTQVLQVRYEFVRWDETDRAVLDGAVETTCVDLSVTGLGLAEVPTLDRSLASQLLAGKKKVRLSVTLDNGFSVLLFGRLVWAGLAGAGPTGRAGLAFLDIEPGTYRILKGYVDERLSREPRPESPATGDR